MNKNQRKRPSTTRFIPIKEEVRKVKIMLSFVHSIFMMQTWLIEERSSKVFLRRAFPQLQLEERHHQQWLLRQCLHHVVRPFLILRLDSPGTKIPANISFFTVHKEKAPAQTYDDTTLKNHPYISPSIKIFEFIARRVCIHDYIVRRTTTKLAQAATPSVSFEH